MKLVKRIEELESIGDLVENGYILSNCCFQNIDFTGLNLKWKSIEIENSVFLGCQFAPKDLEELTTRSVLIFPKIPDIPYNAYRSDLYTWQELYEMHSAKANKSKDEVIYQHFYKYKYADHILEALYQRLHDHSIDDALFELLGRQEDGNYKKKSIGIMGGHSTLRSDLYYKKVAKTSFLLARRGYLVASGGGPGIMEAANLGAYMSTYSEKELDQALAIINSDHKYDHPQYHQNALEVLSLFKSGAENLAIPTWFYGHEPSNLFASHIAKYFSNSIREDTLLAICLHGIVFAPGSAGTNQEIFMDLAQNHYGTFDHYSPMVFLGSEHYSEKTQLFQLVNELSKGKMHHKLLYLSDEPNEIHDFINDNPPILKLS